MVRIDLIITPTETEADIARLSSDDWFAQAAQRRAQYPNLEVLSFELSPGSLVNDAGAGDAYRTASEEGRSVYLFATAPHMSGLRPIKLDPHSATTITFDANGVRVE